MSDRIQTLRKELKRIGFDWGTGKIIISDMNGAKTYWYDSDRPEPKIVTDMGDKLLDYEYDTSYGSADCPAFIAEDKEFIYLPYQYDGATGLFRVAKDIDYYMEYSTPYPGA